MEEEWVNGGFGKRVEKTKENKVGWEEGSFDDVKIDTNKKTVLFFNGNGGIEPKDANYGAKFIEGMVGKAEENGYDLYSFYYGHEKEKNTGSFSPEERQNIYDSFFKPFIYDEDGNILPEEQVENNLQNLRIYAYCMGMNETNILLAKMDESLTKNFGEEKSKKLLENVFVVSFAPWEEPTYGTNVEFKALKDYKTKEPWYVSNHANDFDRHAPYTGIAQIEPNKEKNGLEIFSNDFVSVGSKVDPHDMGWFLKESGVIARGITAKDKDGSRVYSRQQSISDMIGISLAYGLTTNAPNLQELEIVLEAQLNQDEKLFQEQEQKVLYEETIDGGRPFLKVLQESGLSLADVYQGKVKKDELKIPISGVKNDSFEAYAVLYGQASKSYSKDICEPPEKDWYGNGLAIYCELFYIHKDEDFVKSTFEVLKNGGSNAFSTNKDLASMHMSGEDLKDSIIMETVVQKDVNQNEKNTMTIDIGKCFKDKEYQSYEELLDGVQDSCEGNIELTPEQTRVILNEAIAARIPFSNIELKNGISLNEEVLENEVDFDEGELIKPKEMVKTETKKNEGMALG